MENTHIEIPGIVVGDDLKKVYKRRNKNWTYKKITLEELEKHQIDGWDVSGKKQKNTVWVKKITKTNATLFEDEVWGIFYRLGFLEMNKDSTFTIPRYDTGVTKQIDVFAREERCVCLVECKSAESPHTRPSLGKDIDQIAIIKDQLARSINSYYESQGIETKFLVGYILALKNIDLNDNDILRAKEAKITIFDEKILEYYQQLSNHFGPSSKYQFLSDIFPNRNIPELMDPVPALKGEMGKYHFYSFVMEPEKLQKIAYISHRGKSNEESIKTYQRMATKRRLNEIAYYITNKSGIFPTSIVINIETDRDQPLVFDLAPMSVRGDSKLGVLHIPNRYQCAWIIDGQHRLFSYSGLPESQTATLPVIAFENLPADVQSKLFVDINGEQVKVPKNHLEDLYSSLHWNSDDPGEQLLALRSRVVKELNISPKSPLRDKFINPGGKKSERRNLTIAGVTEELKYTKLVGFLANSKAKSISPGPLYQDDLDSTLIRSVDVISRYYNLFLENENIKKQWELGGADGGYICTNLGIQATLRVLTEILEHLEKVERLEVRYRNIKNLMDDISRLAMPVINYLSNASPEILRTLKRRIGQSGLRESTNTLLLEINKEIPEFNPVGLKEFKQKIDTTNNKEAYHFVIELTEPLIQNHVITQLKKQLGPNKNQWWHVGVKDKIRNDATLRANAQGEYDNVEKYLYLINLKVIIEEHWDIFGDVYTFESKTNDSKKKKLAWFDKLNEIRNKVAHPQKGGVTDNELEFSKKMYQLIMDKIGTME